MRFDSGLVTEKTVVELDSKNLLTVHTPVGSVVFDNETVDILIYLSNINLLNPTFMIEMMGGVEYLRRESERLEEYAKAFEEEKGRLAS